MLTVCDNTSGPCPLSPLIPSHTISMCLKRPAFQPVSSGDAQDSHGVTIMRGHLSLDSRGIFSTSLWVWIALGLLLVSNVLFFTSFVTNHWGLVHTQNETYWEVGLWQSCRYQSHQDLCIGPGWPREYIFF